MAYRLLADLARTPIMIDDENEFILIILFISNLCRLLKWAVLP